MEARMSNNALLEAKKRLMFVKGDDFYYLAYNTLILLHELGCSSKPLKDHRKLAYVLDFVADPRLISILCRSRELMKRPNPRDRHELVRAYSDGAARVHLIARLVHAMEVRGLIQTERQSDTPAANLLLNSAAVPAAFFESDLYDQEKQNVIALQRIVPLLRTTTLQAMLRHLFTESGVHVWLD